VAQQRSAQGASRGRETVSIKLLSCARLAEPWSKKTSPFRRTERRCDQWRAVPRIRSDQVVFGLAKDLQSGRISLRHLCVILDTSQRVLSLIEQLACPWFSRSLVSFPSFLRLPSFPPPPRIFLGHRAYSTYCLVLYRRIPRSPSLPLSGDRARHH